MTLFSLGIFQIIINIKKDQTVQPKLLHSLIETTWHDHPHANTRII
jgi:hypothetical protein